MQGENSAGRRRFQAKYTPAEPVGASPGFMDFLPRYLFIICEFRELKLKSSLASSHALVEMHPVSIYLRLVRLNSVEILSLIEDRGPLQRTHEPLPYRRLTTGSV